MPDVITYFTGAPRSLELDLDAMLGPCPSCNRGNVLLVDERERAIGRCEHCDRPFVVELIVRLSPVGA